MGYLFTKRVKAFRGYLVLFLLFSSLFFADSLNAQWVKTSTYSNGTIRSLAFSGSYIYAGGTGVYVSRDGGQNWFSIRGPKDKSSKLVTVQSMTVLGSRLYAGIETGDGVFVSDDGGRNWKILNNGLSNGGSIYTVNAMLTVGNKVYATGFGKVYSISGTDTTWTSGTGLANANVMALTINSNGVLFAALRYAGVYRSTDQGQTWTQVNNGLTNLNVHAIIASGTKIFAGTDRGPFVSTDDGQSWTAANTGFNGTVYSFASVGTKIFAGTDGEVYLTTDNGQNWSISKNYVISYQHSTMAVNGDTLFTVPENGAFLATTDKGLTWTDRNKGLQLLGSNFITSMGNCILAGFNVSTDFGASWKPVKGPYGISSVYAAASSGKNFLLGTGTGIYVSSDTGKTWNKASTGYNSMSYGFATLNGVLYSGVDNAVYSSTDNGLTWTVVNAGLKDEFYNKCFIYSIVAAGTQLYVRTSQGVFYSDDNGINWKLSKVLNVSTSTMMWLGVCKDVPFLSTNLSTTTVKASTDKGATWSYASTLLPSNTTVSFFLSVGDSIFASTSNGVYTYDLTRATWLPANDGFPAMISQNPAGPMTQVGQFIFAIHDYAVWGRSLAGITTLDVKDKKTNPDGYSLSQNYPNPFNPATVISYSIPKESNVELKIYDMLGREVAVLVNKEQNAGEYKVQFNASGLPSGVYIYMIKAGEFLSSKKLMLIK